jgi:hypothetical protein
MLRTYRGGCHCQSVRFEAQIDFSEGTTKCNCTFCSKTRLWLVNVRLEAFRLLTDENALTVYRGKNPFAHHPFCKRCGVHVFKLEQPAIGNPASLILSIPNDLGRSVEPPKLADRSQTATVPVRPVLGRKKKTAIREDSGFSCDDWRMRGACLLCAYAG